MGHESMLAELPPVPGPPAPVRESTCHAEGKGCRVRRTWRRRACGTEGRRPAPRSPGRRGTRRVGRRRTSSVGAAANDPELLAIVHLAGAGGDGPLSLRSLCEAVERRHSGYGIPVTAVGGAGRVRPDSDAGLHRAARAFRLDQAGSGSGGRCVQLQGGGGSHCGASATDDNPADVRAGPREPGLIQTKGPSRAASSCPALRTPCTGGTVVDRAGPAGGLAAGGPGAAARAAHSDLVRGYAPRYCTR